MMGAIGLLQGEINNARINKKVDAPLGVSTFLFLSSVVFQVNTVGSIIHAVLRWQQHRNICSRKERKARQGSSL
jgi:hypothetical protein